MKKPPPNALVLTLVMVASACSPPPAPLPAETAVPPAELVAATASVLPQFLQDRKNQGYGDDLEIVDPVTQVLRSNATEAATRLTFYTRRPGKTDGVQWVIEVPLHKEGGSWTAMKYQIQRKSAARRIEE